MQSITILEQGQNDNDFSIQNGNIIIEDACNGLIQKSPNGTCYKILISDTGAVSTVQVPCP